MKMYRLKKEAVEFFKDDIATSILSWDTWNNMKVDDKALEEVKPCYLAYGHESLRPDSRSSVLGGWDENGCKFHFTIVFPDVKYQEYDRFHKGKIVRDLMNKIQNNIDSFFEEFVNENKLETK